VQQSGGHVTVESTPDEGSIFRVYLPRTTETRAVPAPAREGRTAQASRGSETILLVEDEGQLRVLARDILRGAGYQVFDAPNAAEAIKASQRHAGPIHLLVTDVVMPHIGGRELARRLATERPRMRVLYMSGYAEDGIVESGTLDPNVAFLPKPITPDTLLGKVRETLDAR
jgi:CheY-like chemotaxis protein